MSLRYYSNTASQASLASAIGASDTSITFTSGTYTGYPTQFPYTAAIARGTVDEELVLVTAASGNTVTVTRAYDGTAGKAHGAGATFTEVVVAQDYREANAHVNATSGVHGRTGNLVGDTDAQTLTNKTLTNPTVTDGTFSGTQAVAAANVTTLTVTGVTTLAGLTLSGNGTVSGTLGVTGAATFSTTLAVTGASTLTGLLTANGGITVPTGKAVTLTDAPGVGTDAANKSYVDGKTWPSSAITDAASTAASGKLLKGDANGRVQSADPSAAQDVATKAYVDAAKPVYKVGGGSVTTNASGDFTITHNLGVIPTCVIVQSRQIAGSTAVHAIGTVTATTFSARSFYNGAAQANATYTIYWRVDA